MAVCPNCQSRFESPLPGRLCDQCAADVIARDRYSPADVRFVSILAGVLGAALLSMPGAFAGFYMGGMVDRASAGSVVGTIVFSLMGIAVGMVVGRTVCRRMEEARQQRSV